jgi:hypothetical protein
MIIVITDKGRIYNATFFHLIVNQFIQMMQNLRYYLHNLNPPYETCLHTPFGVNQSLCCWRPKKNN